MRAEYFPWRSDCRHRDRARLRPAFSSLARLALFLAALTGLVGGAGFANAETIDDSMNWALRSSLAAQGDNARQAAAEAKLRGSVDAFMPTVSYVQEHILSSKITYSPDFSVPDASGADSTPRHEPNASGIQASLPLFDGFKRYNNYQAAKTSVDAGKYLQVDKRQQILLDAANAYLALIRDRKIVSLRQKQVADIGEIASRTKARFSVRDVTLTDVDISQSRLLAAQTALEQAQADLQASQVEYARITGVQPGALPDPHIPTDCVPATVEELKEALVRSNPKFQAARLDSIAAGYAAKAAVADVPPQVNLVASSMEQTDISDALNRAHDNTVKIQMRVPIYEPGALPRISEASALARQKSWETADSQQQGVAAATSLYLRHQSTIAQVERANARVGTMLRAVNGYRIERAAGFRTVVDILNAQNELTEAQLARVNLEFARDSQVFTIAASLARLGPTHIVTGQPPSTLWSAARTLSAGFATDVSSTVATLQR